MVLTNTDAFFSQGILSIFLHMNLLYTFVFDDMRPSERTKVINNPSLDVAECIMSRKVNKQVEFR